MNYALLDPQIIYNNDPNLQIVAYVEKVRGPFEVCPPFYWVECPDNVEAHDWYYDLNTEVFVEIPQPEPPVV